MTLNKCVSGLERLAGVGGSAESASLEEEELELCLYEAEWGAHWREH